MHGGHRNEPIMSSRNVCSMFAVEDAPMAYAHRHQHVGELFAVGASTCDVSHRWRLELCTPGPLPHVHPQPPAEGSAPRVLFVISDDPSAPLSLQVARTLMQLRSARVGGMLPIISWGRRASAMSLCGASSETKASQVQLATHRYFEAGAGENVWDYFFEQPCPACAAIGGRPGSRFFVAPVPGGGDATADDADDAHQGGLSLPAAAHQSSGQLWARRLRQRLRMARLLREFVRVRPEVARAAHELLAPWRQQAAALLGVAFDNAHRRATSAQRAALHEYADGFLRANGPRAAIVVVGAGPAELEGVRRRHGRDRVRTRDDGMPACARGPTITGGARDGRCAGLEELVDALLLVSPQAGSSRPSRDGLG